MTNKIKTNQLVLWHGKTPQGGLLSSVVEECKNFLGKHPNETIIMSVKNEAGSGSEFAKIFKKTCVDNFKSSDGGDLFYIGEDIPKLKDVRGKIVLLRRFDFDVNLADKLVRPLGINLEDWTDNKEVGEAGSKDPLEKRQSTFQDYYDLSGANLGDFTHKKFDAVKTLLGKASSSSNNGETVFINFCSAANVPPIPTEVPFPLSLIKENLLDKLPDPKIFAEHVNPKLSEYLTRSPRGMYGCVLMDFPENTPQLIHQLIASNF